MDDPPLEFVVPPGADVTTGTTFVPVDVDPAPAELGEPAEP